MSRLPIVNLAKMERLLLKLGFERVRQKGGHTFYRHPDATTIPNHPGRDLARPLIREILKDIELTPEQFEEELKKI